MIVPDERLRRLVDATAAEMKTTRAEEPPFARMPGESSASWRRRIETARAAADAEAIARRGAVDRATRRLFGTTLTDLLPDTGPLTRGEFRVPVPTTDCLGDVADELRGVTPAGSGERLRCGPADSVRVSVTAPADPTGAVILRLHGGAFWMGGGEAADRVDALLIDHLAGTTGATVLNVDHRLAPEHPFPAPIIDVLCLLRHLRDGSLHDDVGHDIDASRIALVGTSSGSNIAVVAAMADARTAPAHPIAALSLIVPSVLLNDAPAHLRDDPAAWAARQRQLQGYLGGAVTADSHWASPAVAPVLTGMPPTFAAIAKYDEIAMGGHELSRAIATGDTPTSAREYTMTHSIALPHEEAAMFADIAAFLRTHI